MITAIILARANSSRLKKKHLLKIGKYTLLEHIYLKLRLNKHNTNTGAKTTKGYKWTIIYSKKFSSKNEAMSYEYKLKNDRKLRKKLLEKST